MSLCTATLCVGSLSVNRCMYTDIYMFIGDDLSFERGDRSRRVSSISCS